MCAKAQYWLEGGDGLEGILSGNGLNPASLLGYSDWDCTSICEMFHQQKWKSPKGEIGPWTLGLLYVLLQFIWEWSWMVVHCILWKFWFPEPRPISALNASGVYMAGFSCPRPWFLLCQCSYGYDFGSRIQAKNKHKPQNPSIITQNIQLQEGGKVSCMICCNILVSLIPKTGRTALWVYNP